MKKDEIIKKISDKSIWKPIIGTSGKYYISKYGDVVSLSQRPQKIKLTKSVKGYMYAMLYINGKNYNRRVHRLVALHFIPNLYNLTEVHHIDGNKENNNANNLEWISHRDNVIESWKDGLSKMTEEQKRKLSLALKGRKLSEEIKKKRKISLERKKSNKNRNEQNI